MIGHRIIAAILEVSAHVYNNFSHRREFSVSLGMHRLPRHELSLSVKFGQLEAVMATNRSYLAAVQKRSTVELVIDLQQLWFRIYEFRRRKSA